MAVTLEKFLKQLEDSGILAGDTIKDFIPPKASPKDAEELARELVRKKKLTKFQVEEVSRGKGKSLVLGNYVLMEKIGAGGMGQVFKARHRRMDRMVAVKLLPPAMTKDQAAIARFEREVKAAAKISHPNIVTAYDADQANGVHFLVMELVEGSDLSALVKKNGPFPVEKAVNYVLQAAKGLEAAHKKGVVHRDIKPANLLLDTENTVKILDMGLARLNNGDEDTPTQAELTGTGTVMGTVDYMAPEQALNTKTADARADIYALGCSLYYLLTGKAAYDGESLMAKLLAHREHPIPSLRATCPDVPEQVENVFQKMVAKKVGDRYQAMTEVIADLERLEANEAAAVTVLQQESISSSANTTADDSAFTFSNSLPTPSTIQQTTVNPKSALAGQVQSGQPPRRNKTFLIGAGLFGVLLLAGIVVSLQTKSGRSAMEQHGTTETKAKLLPVNEKPVVAAARKPFAYETPDFDDWMKQVAAMPAKEQAAAVGQKLMEFNPDFDGSCWPSYSDGMVTTLSFNTDHLTDISPVRALTGLRLLHCAGSLSPQSSLGVGKLSDLSQIKGMKLEHLAIVNNPGVTDLSPLAGMPLTELHVPSSQVSDLTPLKGMKLAKIDLANTLVSNLSPLREMPLDSVICNITQVSDLSPLEGMPLQELQCGSTRVTDFTPLRKMRLKKLHVGVTGISDLELFRGMPLNHLNCFRTQISDLSPLQGMPLAELIFSETKVSDLSPLKGLPLTELMFNDTPVSDVLILEGMNLKTLIFTPKAIIQGMPIIRRMTSLEKIGPSFGNELTVDDFWKKYDAGEFGKPTTAVTPLTDFNSSAFRQWVKEVQSIPADQQVEAVSRKLVELNPGFDGRVTAGDGKSSPKIEGGVVTEFGFVADYVTDISPVRALAGLKVLMCYGSENQRGRLSDLSPLEGMRLENLVCFFTQVSDLSPVRGMPLRGLVVYYSKVSDLAPLEGLPLEHVDCSGLALASLTPLTGCKNLRTLIVRQSRVAAAEIDVLQKAVPECRVEWDGPAKSTSSKSQ